MCGCGTPVPRADRGKTSEGIVKGEFKKFVIGHHRRLSPVEYLVDEETGCWNWQRCIDRKGYGMVKFTGGGSAGAHRFIYERHRGTIATGMQLDHLCRNTRCVNPDHLEPVTCAENLRRGRGTKLIATQVIEIRDRYESGADSMRSLASEFGVASAYIHQIIRRKVWTDI
jgi:hypothetical protein